jgi:SAM-dependent methyltransferase
MDWHKRYLQQALWTKDLRAYLFRRAGMGVARKVVEIGCGTGAILSELNTSAAIHGLDLELVSLLEANLNAPRAILACGDALSLPFATGVFDITFCHFLLLWVRDPLQALLEMKRITRPGGTILALAEPDYYNRVDKPDELASLGRWQAESLHRQGADPGLGMHLQKLFLQAGISIIETGTLHTADQHTFSPEDRDLEWAVMEADLMDQVTKDEMQRLKILDERAWVRGIRVLFVPTYWAFGTSG